MPSNQVAYCSRRRILCCAVAMVLIAVLLSLAVGCSNFSAGTRNAEGVRLYQQARYHEALQQFHEATYSDPNNPDGYYNIAATYHRIGVTENRPSDLAQAEQYYHQCLDVWDRLDREQPTTTQNTGQTDCYRGLAVLLVEQGHYDKAFRLLEGWVEREPASADAKIELARLFDEFNDHRAARYNLEEALAIDSDNPRALAALGKIHEETGKYAQALKDYQRSYARDRFQPQLANRIAALRSQLNPAMSSTHTGTRVVDQGSTSLR